jgi:RNA recognition motif-containing protein
MAQIFVGNLNFDASEEAVRKIVEDHGQARNIEMPIDWDSGHARGFALVELEDCAAERAIRELNGATLDGWKLTVRRTPEVPPVGFGSLSAGED